MKKVYFVRHAEGIGNAKLTHSGSLAGLTEKGKVQAKIISRKFSKIEIDLIISSTFTRAKQTKDIINNNLNKPERELDLFIERNRPTEIHGLKYEDPKALKVKNQIKNNYHDPDFKHSDEETFFEMKERARKALNYLENLKEENVLVITHGDFMLCMLGMIIFGNEYSSHTDLKFTDAFKSENTGITICEFNKRWRILAWNDHAHLE